VANEDGSVTALLHGCDEIEAGRLVKRHGGQVLEVRLAEDRDLLTGPPAHLPTAER
jgi:hypothetical protein